MSENFIITFFSVSIQSEGFGLTLPMPILAMALVWLRLVLNRFGDASINAVVAIFSRNNQREMRPQEVETRDVPVIHPWTARTFVPPTVALPTPPETPEFSECVRKKRENWYETVE